MLPVVAGARRDAPADPDLFAACSRRSALAPWLLGFAGLALRRGRARLRRADAGARLARLSRPRRPRRGCRGASSCSPFRSSICSCCSPCCWSSNALARLRTGCDERRHDDERTGIVLTEEQKRRRRARSIAIALSLGALVVLFYVVTVVKWTRRAEPAVVNAMSATTSRPARAPPRPHRRRRLRRVRRRDGRHGLCGGAALRLVLPRHRLRRHARRSRPSAPQARARPHDHGALRRQCRRRAAVALRAGAERRSR